MIAYDNNCFNSSEIILVRGCFLKRPKSEIQWIRLSNTMSSVLLSVLYGLYKRGCGQQILELFLRDPNPGVHVLVWSSPIECGWNSRLVSTQKHTAKCERISHSTWVSYFAYECQPCGEKILFSLLAVEPQAARLCTGYRKGHMARCWGWIPVNSWQETDVFCPYSARSWMLWTTPRAWKQILPQVSPKWDCSPAQHLDLSFSRPWSKLREHK